MRINFPKLVRAIDLTEYAPEISAKVSVWVNPPTKFLEELGTIFNKYVDSEGKDIDEFLAQMSTLYSQGEKDTHLTPAELKELVEGTRETDPAFWSWLQNRTLETISDHRNALKKSLKPPAQS